MNEAEEDERCAKHKIFLNAVCLTCNNMKCCYKCFNVNNSHFNHNSLFLSECDQYYSDDMQIIQEQPSSQFDDQNQLKEKKKVFSKQLINKANQDSSSNLTNQIKTYRMQIDDLCKQITEQVWNYRQKFIQYMDSKLKEYNAFIQVEQGSQITSEMIIMRNELENFINSLKNQIKSIDTQNQQKQNEVQPLPCSCSQAISIINNNYSQNNAFTHFNNGNYFTNDEDLPLFSNSSPSCYSISYSCSSSSASSPSPSSYSSSSPYYYNSYQTQKIIQNQYHPNTIFSQKHHQRNNEQMLSQQFTEKNAMNNLCNQMHFNIYEMQYHQHLSTCPNYQLQKQISENQMQIYSQAIQQKSIQNQIEPKQLSQIFIILTNGKSLPLQFNISSSVLQIKILIFEKTGVPPLEQKLFYYTKELHNYTAMKEYQIPRDCSIKLYIRSFYQQLQSISKNQSTQNTKSYDDSFDSSNQQFSLQFNKQFKNNQNQIESQFNLIQSHCDDFDFDNTSMIPDSQCLNSTKKMSFQNNQQQNSYLDKNQTMNSFFYENNSNQQNIFIYS
ncbi:ubiquitin family protein (macronuclear) [Tetrahymena thermophila SB210]|uniref:Ubiquitin family protein n=1 Tax=Tetrahymena thermophila (strain SB210) TaxID=312017 RepID=Q232I7_TETTS|nr:ubiquitin family protein [Tetrahymena thermophila SB210]EAR91425.1 ubiquitin family protein [Tetrahymena thermophila SB210]|eukprot:XP_001011670.1 ubiquitin family protein [Tetrahymena thermophila SB210]